MNQYEYIGLFIIFLYNIFSLIYDNEKLNKIKKMLDNKFLLVNLFLVFSLFAGSEYLYQSDKNYYKYKHLKNVIIKSLIAFIIALYAYLDMIIAPFWTIFLISYLFPDLS